MVKLAQTRGGRYSADGVAVPGPLLDRYDARRDEAIDTDGVVRPGHTP